MFSVNVPYGFTRAVPILDDIEPLVNLTAEFTEPEIAAEEDRAVFDHVIILGRDQVPVDGASEDGLEVGIGLPLTRVGPVELLVFEVLEARRELKAQRKRGNPLDNQKSV
jgi:hypothetical protein